jgi:hypothetical protein
LQFGLRRVFELDSNCSFTFFTLECVSGKLQLFVWNLRSIFHPFRIALKFWELSFM